MNDETVPALGTVCPDCQQNNVVRSPDGDLLAYCWHTKYGAHYAHSTRRWTVSGPWTDARELAKALVTAGGLSEA